MFHTLKQFSLKTEDGLPSLRASVKGYPITAGSVMARAKGYCVEMAVFTPHAGARPDMMHFGGRAAAFGDAAKPRYTAKVTFFLSGRQVNPIGLQKRLQSPDKSPRAIASDHLMELNGFGRCLSGSPIVAGL